MNESANAQMSDVHANTFYIFVINDHDCDQAHAHTQTAEVPTNSYRNSVFALFLIMSLGLYT